MTADPLVRRHTDRAVAVLTLDSPHNRNALSAELLRDLARQLQTAESDPAVRAVLLTHTGNTFCAGADLKADGPGDGPQVLCTLMTWMTMMRKPVVARVDGHVRGGGLGLLAVCDISVASSAAGFAFTEVRLGVAPALASIPVLAGAEPRAAARYLLTGETFDTAEAVRIGLVTATDDALPGVLDGLRASSPQGLAETKKLTTLALQRSLATEGGRLARRSTQLFASAEATEGIRAALERRDPPWAR